MKTLANEICNSLLDMDFTDYAEVNEMETENLLNDLELLKELGNGTLLNAIKMLVE